MNWKHCDFVLGLQFSDNAATKAKVLWALNKYITELENTDYIPQMHFIFDELDNQIGYVTRKAY